MRRENFGSCTGNFRSPYVPTTPLHVPTIPALSSVKTGSYVPTIPPYVPTIPLLKSGGRALPIRLSAKPNSQELRKQKRRQKQTSRVILGDLGSCLIGCDHAQHRHRFRTA